MALAFRRLCVLTVSCFLVFGCASNKVTNKNDATAKVDLLVLEQNAETAYQSGHLELSEGLYRQLLTHSKNYSPAWFRLGNIYTRTNRLDAAVNAYQNSIASDIKAWAYQRVIFAHI